VARVLSTAVVLALLAATAVAFAITEGAKLDKSPIAATQVDPIFSPESRVDEKREAHVRFRLRTPERITVWIRNADGQNVRTLLTNRTARRGARFDLVWDGFSPSGIVQPDGTYEPVVKLGRSHRTIVLPSPIVLDTKAPVVTVKHPQYPLLSPDGDGRRDRFTVHYTLNKPAHAILAVRGRRVLFTKGQKTTGEIVWDGRVKNSQGRLVRAKPGRYLLTISAQDRAGNVAKGFPFAIAQVRYLTLARKRVVVRPGRKFALRVSTDAPAVRWRLRGRSGVQRAGTLHFRAPKSTGVFQLYVFTGDGDHAARCAVVVA
jgi:hypothetical protein